MKSCQTGVGRVELIVVAIILAIAANAAMPKRMSLPQVAEAAAAAMTLNYAGCATNDQQASPKTCVRVTSCQQAPLLMYGGLPAGHTIDGETRQFNGDHLRCRVLGPDGAAAPFAGLVAGV